MLRYFLTVVLLISLASTLVRSLRTVNIPSQGNISGVEVSKSRIQKIVAYYGIPYAQPPVGDLRFAPPVTDPLPSWNDVKNNTDYAPACLQTRADYKKPEESFLQLLSENYFPGNMSEDCLYLNVFVPYGNKPTSGYATIIWFHPGNLTTGTPAIWDPHTLVYRQRVIIVTFAFRLNIMGFFTTMDGEAPGNFGLMDQQAAMDWVKNNIEHFGGNPNNICIMGYGTGATSVGIHMVNPGSRGLFHKSIVMSGNLLSSSEIKLPSEHKSLIDRLARDFACDRKPTSKLISCLRNADPMLLVEQTSNVNWSPLLDKDLYNDSNSSPFLPELPRTLYERGEFEKMPLMTGYTNMEHVMEYEDVLTPGTNVSNQLLRDLLVEILSGDVPPVNTSESSCVYNYDHIEDAVMFFYRPSTPLKDLETFREIVVDFMTERTYGSSTFLHASYVSRENQPTYMYRFDVKPTTDFAVKNISDWVGVPHLYDLLYVWGVPYWRTDVEWDTRDKRIADTIMSFWTHFAKSSDPESSIDPIKWRKFTEENPGILILDGSFNMDNSVKINYKAFEFWNEFYPKVLEIATQCCTAQDSSSSNFLNPFLITLYGAIFIYNLFLQLY